MNKYIIATLFLILAFGHYVNAQTAVDSSAHKLPYPRFSTFLTEEESWELHKEAYQKKLEAEELSKEEMELKMLEYEKQKEEMIARIKNRRMQIDRRREFAEAHRNRAKRMRSMAEQRRKQAHERRKTAVGLRKQAAEMRNDFKKLHREELSFSKDKSESRSIKVSVDEEGALFFKSKASVISGYVHIEIFDPNGKKEGELSLEQSEANDSEDNNKVTGTLNKTINVAKAGDWLIKIKSEKSQSIIAIAVVQWTNHSIDE